MIPDILDQLSALNALATDAPWRDDNSNILATDTAGRTRLVADFVPHATDRALILAMRNSLPDLIAEVTALRADKARLDAPDVRPAIRLPD